MTRFDSAMAARRLLSIFALLATVTTMASCALYEELAPPQRPSDIEAPDASGDTRAPDTDADARPDAETDTTETPDVIEDIRVEPTLDIAPKPVRVALNATLQLSATYRDDRGQPVPNAPIEWQVADTDIATIDPQGLLTGLRIGQTEVTAQVDDTSLTVSLEVFSPIARIELTPASAVVDVGATAQFSATLFDTEDAPITGFEVTWTSSDDTVATIDPQGLLTGIAEGAATIHAEALGTQASAQVGVFAPVDRVEVEPDEATIEVTQSVQLLARVFDIYDALRDDRPVTWTSLDPEVASVDESGLVRGLHEGVARIVAQSGDKDAEASIRVEAPVRQVSITPQPASVGVGQTLQLSAHLEDAAGNPLQGREVLWESSDPTLATVDAQGLVEGKVGGRVTITATSEGVSASARVDIANPVAQIDVSPDPLQLNILQTQQMTATLRDAAGNLLENRAITWRSADSNVASVDADGLVTAQSAGSVEISASAEGVRGGALVTVRNVVTSIDITPAQTTLEVTDTVQMTAIAKNARGFVIPGLTATWTSSHPAVVTVTADGRIEGIKGGQATITAQIEAVTATAEVTVDAPVRSITLTPATSTLEITDTLRLSATLKDKGGNTLSGRSVQWTSDHPNIASVDANGLVSANARGTTTIRAQADQASASASITVATPVHRIVLTPTSETLEITDSLQLAATVQDKAGNTLSGQTIQWASDNPSIASVTPTGRVTALAGGNTTIRASVGEVTAGSSITVDTPVRSIQITPPSQTLEITDTAQLSAQLRDKAGNLLTGRSVQWTSSAPGIASVNTAGKVTALAGGSATIHAQADFANASATIQVVTPVRAIQHSPTSQTLEITKTQQFTATAKDKAGNTLSGQTFQWQTAHASIASVTSSGKVSALARGNTSVLASIGSVSASAGLSVITPPRSLTITPNPATLMVGGTLQLVATARDLAGNTLSAQTTTWTSDAPAIASVFANGAATTTLSAHSVGSTQIHASIQDPVSGTIQASAAAQVQPQVVASVTITPARLVLFPEDQAVLSATCRDTNGNPVSGHTITWSSDAPATASVGSSNGKVTAHALGATTIRANCAGIVGQLPVEVVRWAQVEASRHFSCGVVTSGDAYCWGQNNVDGVLGNGTKDSGLDNQNLNHDADALRPSRVDTSVRFARIAPGMFHVCALDDNGKAYCWGSGGAGHLGNGQHQPSPTPVAVLGNYRFSEIGVGANHACALALNGDVYCWGYNGQGQLGLGGGATSYSAPQRVGTRQYVALSVGANHACAIGADNWTYCWGENPDGRLGDGTTEDRSSPTPVDTSTTFVDIAAGYDHSCAITQDGKMFCWGLNDYQQLGSGLPELVQPAPVSAHSPEAFVKVAVGSGTTCGLTAAGHAYCWGFNGQGNLGNGSLANIEVGPTTVGGISNIPAMSLGLQHSCGLSGDDGEAWCTGDNDFGQLGIGHTSSYSSYPLRVERP